MLLRVPHYYHYYPQDSAIALNSFGIPESTFQSIYRTRKSVLLLWWHLILARKKKKRYSLVWFVHLLCYLLRACHVLKDKGSSQHHVRLTGALSLGPCGYSPRKWGRHLLRVPTGRSAESPAMARGRGKCNTEKLRTWGCWSKSWFHLCLTEPTARDCSGTNQQGPGQY